MVSKFRAKDENKQGLPEIRDALLKFLWIAVKKRTEFPAISFRRHIS